MENINNWAMEWVSEHAPREIRGNNYSVLLALAQSATDTGLLKPPDLRQLAWDARVASIRSAQRAIKLLERRWGILELGRETWKIVTQPPMTDRGAIVSLLHLVPLKPAARAEELDKCKLSEAQFQTALKLICGRGRNWQEQIADMTTREPRTAD